VACGGDGGDGTTTGSTTGTATGAPTGTQTGTSTGTNTGGTTGTATGGTYGGTGSWCGCVATITTKDAYDDTQAMTWNKYDCDYWVVEEAFDFAAPFDGPEASLAYTYDADHNLLDEWTDFDGDGEYDLHRMRTWHSSGLPDTFNIDDGNDGSIDIYQTYLNDGSKVTETRVAWYSNGVDNERVDWFYDAQGQVTRQEAWDWYAPATEDQAFLAWQVDWTWPGPNGGERLKAFDFNLATPEYDILEERTFRDDKRIEFNFDDFNVADGHDDGSNTFYYLQDGRLDYSEGHLYDPNLVNDLAGLDGYADTLVTYVYDSNGYTSQAFKQLDTNRDGDFDDTLDIELVDVYSWDCSGS